tara:strand:- start:746 stop:2428 length:1683 start_codon:yes stop_codon:yes gene_type:complete
LKLIKYFSILFITLFWVILIYCCASIQAPSGGPKDETPPELIQTIPENKTIFFKEDRVELVFSEYLDEKSVYNSITIMPKLKKSPDFIYKGNRLFIDFHDSLIYGQTYIISIDRSLKDEHGVNLKKGLQIAYATGGKINEGSISGTIKYSKPASAQLWKIKSKEDLVLFYKREPDYIVDASDNGNYHFQFLSSGQYKIVGVDQSITGISIDPKRTITGLPWEMIIKLDNDEIVSGVDMIIPDKLAINKINRAEWTTGEWFKLFFSEDVSNIVTLLSIQAFSNDSILKVIDIFMDDEDEKVIHLVLDKSINSPSLITFFLKDVYDDDDKLFDSSRVTVKMDTVRDTTNAKIKFPEESYIHAIENEKIVPVKIRFSTFMKKYIVENSVLLMQDSILIPFKYDWISPLTLMITPFRNWISKTNYQLEIHADKLYPIYGESLVDSVTTISFQTSSYIKFGRLLGELESSIPRKIIAQVKDFEKGINNSHAIVNFDGTFLMNRLREGNYSLLFFEDSDGNNHYSYGTINPYKPAEWFFIFPDTVKIRGNWDMELNNIQIKKNFLR